ncbi:general substrate transporter [Cylindrobasidium torrendii FP15055 ss-10]|uniref:General substrate transporter n=1 Tax=Cylindrobasidium torrendii FP15055 ss-10 TaxID=1314674 RepID=A0A0D7BPD3_9AGAR|nr:general substrate transporter [Cylindrobasidium torrendii FP15055 ss-10]
MSTETTDTRFQNIRVYWLAFIVYWGIVLFGYDTGVGGGVVNNALFQKHFGMWDGGVKDKKKIDSISSIVVSVLQAGAFFGALGSSFISPKIGRRYTLFTFAALFLVGAILTTVAKSPSNGLALIYAGRVISGVGIGGISAVAPAYVSESAPKEIRGRVTGLFQIMVATGVMLSYFINYGIGIHVTDPDHAAKVWQIPFGFQLVPAGIMTLGLFTVKESPRWLASVDRHEEALNSLAYLRKRSIHDESVLHELAEIEAAIAEEREARNGLGLKEAFFGKGNFIRFVIAFVIFLLQQWSGQNSVNYYAPQIFASIGYSGTKNSLLASGVYGVVKLVATAIFIFFGVETIGRKMSLIISAYGMGALFYVVGAILKTHPPPATSAADASPSPEPASQAMAAMLYIYVCFYSLGWGPLPWVYVSDIFPTRTRHYGLAVASASQWLFNFVVSKVTPDLVRILEWKLFIMFATINVGAMGTFALLIPETKGRSLEDMDIIFGSVTAEQRHEDILKQERANEKDANGSLHSVQGKV